MKLLAQKLVSKNQNTIKLSSSLILTVIFESNWTIFLESMKNSFF